MNSVLNLSQEEPSELSFPHFLGVEEAKERNLQSYTSREKMNSHSALKTQFLKKKEGESLLRRDIQYMFLDLVVNNDQEVFTLPQGATHKKVTFGELYVTYVRRSPKTSKVLREKLENDKTLAVALVMVALLVNIGRINTTLSHILRQEHIIRFLHFKRIQMISEDLPEHLAWQSLLDAQKSQLRPSTNPINLIFIFVLCSTRISSLHFNSSIDFIDLFTKASFSSESRAKAFLWLCWHYLETDGSAEVATKNPFSSGNNENPLNAPNLDIITEEDAALENIDTPMELEYAAKMAEERKRYLQENENLKSNSQDISNIRRKNRPKETNKKEDVFSSPEISKPPPSVENQDECFNIMTKEDFQKRQFKQQVKTKKRKEHDPFYNSGDEEGNYTLLSGQQANSKSNIVEQKNRIKKVSKQQFKKGKKNSNYKQRKEGAIQKEWKRYSSFSPLEDSDKESETEYDQSEHIVGFLTSLNRAYHRTSKSINQMRIFAGKKPFNWELPDSNPEKKHEQKKKLSSVQDSPVEHPQVGGKTLSNLIRMVQLCL
ncbi:unnamed protein product [Pneumocystis jirovecii]|uniref:Ino eighty subunit 1 n=1 Tax=Pneumocystis jirovecii TaxID=42068 RepID=L0PCR7_PNEJI|nr:unnamed protein product [Pneumocystis jirovecii]